MTALR
jgi:hypothetical protein